MRNQFIKPTRKRIIFKLGSHVLQDNGTFTTEAVRTLATQMVDLSRAGNDVLLITSGAVLMGRSLLNLNLSLYPRNLKQVLAAIGQVEVISEYARIFGSIDQPIGQILINLEDFHHRHRYLNIKETILGLFKLNVLPVLNENDTIYTEDTIFGDNDNLASQVAGMLDADLLVILSTVDGLYDGDPGASNSRVIPEVTHITGDMLNQARSRGQLLSAGGMAAKLQAIKNAVHTGIPVILANGRTPAIIQSIFSGAEVGTLFQPEGKRMPLKKRWLAYSTRVNGMIRVDAGAYRAIAKGKASLLSSGVVEAIGDFDAQDTIAIATAEGVEFARGITNYGSSDVQAIAGLSNNQVAEKLGMDYFDEVVHREELVLLPEETKEKA